MSCVPIHNLFKSPSLLDSPGDRAVHKIHLCAPFSHRLAGPSVREHAVVSPISGLLKIISPVAVIGLVVGAIVASLKGFPFGLFAHVFQKIGKALPSFAEPYSAPSVVAVVAVIWVCAASFHPGPAVIRRRGLAIHRAVSVLCAALNACVAMKAPTRPGSTITKHYAVNGLFSAALAPAKPLSSALASVFSPGNHSPAADDFSNKIDGSHVGNYNRQSIVSVHA